MASSDDLCDPCFEIYRLWKPWEPAFTDVEKEAVKDRYMSEINSARSFDFGTTHDLVNDRRTCPLCNLVFQLIPPDSYREDRLDFPDSNHDIFVDLFVNPSDGFSKYPGGIRLSVEEGGRSRGCICAVRSDNAQEEFTAPPGSVLVRPPADLDLEHIKSWLALPSANKFESSISRPADVSFIDVLNGSIVTGTTSHPYLALSYVWGHRPSLEATLSNKAELSKPGALKELESEIPTVIRDAIHFTQMVGERYLWVDSLCIEQDNLEHKSIQIGQMDAVYAQAKATLIALSAQDAESPLPGVEESTRLCQKAEVVIDNLRFIVFAPEFGEICETARYQTRAWTLQEALLSNKKLFFTNHKLYFSLEDQFLCDGMDEDFRRTSSDYAIRTMRLTEEIRGAARGIPCKSLAEEPESGEVTAFAIYEMLVTIYTQRLLSYESDRVNAISSLFKAIGSNVWERYVAGLPLRSITLALLWIPAGDGRILNERNPLFPSWSWAGMTGTCHYIGGPLSLCLAAAPNGSRQYLLRNETSTIKVVDDNHHQDFAFDCPILEISSRVFNTSEFTFDLQPVDLIGDVRSRNTGFVELFPCSILDNQGQHCGCIFDWADGKKETDNQTRASSGFDLDPKTCKAIVLSSCHSPCIHDGSECSHGMTEAWDPSSSSSLRNCGLFSKQKWLLDPACFTITPWSILNVMFVRIVEENDDVEYAERVAVGQIHRDILDKVESSICKIKVR